MEGEVIIAVRVRNSGTRHGRETIQVYASRPASALERPTRWPAGFANIEVDSDAEMTAETSVPLRRLAHGDTVTSRWPVEPGEYPLSVGRSSHDLPIVVTLTIGQAPERRAAGC
jgi:beta-glucosidase